MTWDDLTAEEQQIPWDARHNMMSPEEYARYEQMVLEWPETYRGRTLDDLGAFCERMWAAAISDFLARRRAGSPGG